MLPQVAPTDAPVTSQRHQQKLPNVISMCCQVGLQEKSLSVGFQQKSVPGEGFDLMFGREL